VVKKNAGRGRPAQRAMDERPTFGSAFFPIGVSFDVATAFIRTRSQKYGASRVNAYHILKSLTYFDDAEAEPMLRMRVPFDWEECKAFFVRQARAIVLP
jgi:hypothetical protein